MLKTTTIGTYFKRFTVKEPQISISPKVGLNIVIVIPCYNEPNLLNTLKSIYNCKHPNLPVEILVVINASEKAPIMHKNQNILTFKEVNEWTSTMEKVEIPIHIIMDNNLPDKKAGVGLARKIGMDEAARRLVENGVIVNLDADSTVDPNYLVEIEQHFITLPKISGCSIFFEHPLKSSDEQNHQIAIAQYELHLRYFIDRMRNINFPYAFQTIGSSMAVRNKDYQLLGGMNTRKAGEDFYFLQKFIKQGHFSELNTTTVYPSSRISDRVPFGTGRAVKDLLKDSKNGSLIYSTYHPYSFRIMQEFLGCINHFYDFDYQANKDLEPFLNNVRFEEKIREIKMNTKSLLSFKKRFYNWFDAFQLIKALHFLRDHVYPNIPILEACKMVDSKPSSDLFEVLNRYRKRARQPYVPII